MYMYSLLAYVERVLISYTTEKMLEVQVPEEPEPEVPVIWAVNALGECEWE